MILAAFIISIVALVIALYAAVGYIDHINRWPHNQLPVVGED